MTTGEGGFVATDQPVVRRALASMRDWGRACYCNDKTPGDVTSGSACGNRFKQWFKPCSDSVYDHRYVFNEIGYNLKPLELQAAIGLEQVKKLPIMDQARRDNYNRLTDIFKPYEKYLHLPAYKSLRDKFDYNDFPVANLATRNSIFLGTYIGITEEKCNYIKTVVDKFFAKSLK